MRDLFDKVLKALFQVLEMIVLKGWGRHCDIKFPPFRSCLSLGNSSTFFHKQLFLRICPGSRTRLTPNIEIKWLQWNSKQFLYLQSLYYLGTNWKTEKWEFQVSTIFALNLTIGHNILDYCFLIESRTVFENLRNILTHKHRNRTSLQKLVNDVLLYV